MDFFVFHKELSGIVDLDSLETRCQPSKIARNLVLHELEFASPLKPELQ